MFRLALQPQGAGEVFDLDDVPGRSHIDSFPVLAAAPPNIIDLTEAEMPAARAGRSRQRWCAGRADSVCCFAADGSGGKARGKHGGQCVFCSDAGMAAAVQTPGGRRNLARMLKQWQQDAEPIFAAAIDRSALRTLAEDMRAVLLPAPQVQLSGADVLTWRVSVAAPLGPAEHRAYATCIEADRLYVRKKFFPARRRTVRHAGWQWQNPLTDELRARIHDIAPNDTGLPRAHVSNVASAMESWCHRGSWGLCGLCGSVQPRHLKESDSRRSSQLVVDKCRNCTKASSKQAWVPWPDEVPQPLRHLSRGVVLALRPLDIDCGPDWKAEYGYYFHSTMIRLTWSLCDVEEKIANLDGEERLIARKAPDCVETVDI